MEDEREESVNNEELKDNVEEIKRLTKELEDKLSKLNVTENYKDIMEARDKISSYHNLLDRQIQDDIILKSFMSSFYHVGICYLLKEYASKENKDAIKIVMEMWRTIVQEIIAEELKSIDKFSKTDMGKNYKKVYGENFDFGSIRAELHQRYDDILHIAEESLKIALEVKEDD